METDNRAVIALPHISFGDDIRRPDRLEARPTDALLLGIRDGQWREPVSRVRSLPADSTEQKTAKLSLPFCTWSGVFTRRSMDGLQQHSGQVGIDLDGLGESGAVAVLQAAVADAFCLAAFRSTRGEGVRLIFRIPPCSPENHALAFKQVAEHVRRVYGHEPDESGKDVSRASFVSFDRGLWCYPEAEILPVQFPDDTQRINYIEYRCVSSPIYGGMLAEPCWTWLGRNHALIVQEGTAKTHRSLLDLGKAIALHGARTKTRLTPRLINEAFDAWLTENYRNGVQMRCKPDDYRRELFISVRGAEKKPWFTAAADKWMRWTRHKDFPQEGMPNEKLLFCIRQHCAEAKQPEFYLGARDAGLIAGTSFKTASRMLNKLCADGHLEKSHVKRAARHAQTFKLLKP